MHLFDDLKGNTLSAHFAACWLKAVYVYSNNCSDYMLLLYIHAELTQATAGQATQVEHVAQSFSTCACMPYQLIL